MTNILKLPLASITATVGDDEDWIAGVAYDVGGVPVDLTGIGITISIGPAETAVLVASASNGRVSLVAGPSSSVPNVVLINIKADEKSALSHGVYRLDGVAEADGHTKDIITGSLTVRGTLH